MEEGWREKKKNRSCSIANKAVKMRQWNILYKPNEKANNKLLALKIYEVAEAAESCHCTKFFSIQNGNRSEEITY